MSLAGRDFLDFMPKAQYFRVKLGKYFERDSTKQGVSLNFGSKEPIPKQPCSFEPIV